VIALPRLRSSVPRSPVVRPGGRSFLWRTVQVELSGEAPWSRARVTALVDHFDSDQGQGGHRERREHVRLAAGRIGDVLGDHALDLIVAIHRTEGQRVQTQRMAASRRLDRPVAAAQMG
jgi:hypothetical protein